MSDDKKPDVTNIGDVMKKQQQPPQAAAPAQQMFAVPPVLMQSTLDLLQEELPMKKVRGIVQLLEKCQIVNLQGGPGDGHNPDNDAQ